MRWERLEEETMLPGPLMPPPAKAATGPASLGPATQPAIPIPPMGAAAQAALAKAIGPVSMGPAIPQHVVIGPNGPHMGPVELAEQIRRLQLYQQQMQLLMVGQQNLQAQANGSVAPAPTMPGVGDNWVMAEVESPDLNHSPQIQPGPLIPALTASTSEAEIRGIVRQAYQTMMQNNVSAQDAAVFLMGQAQHTHQEQRLRDQVMSTTQDELQLLCGEVAVPPAQ